MATRADKQDMIAWAYEREKDRMPEEFEKGM